MVSLKHKVTIKTKTAQEETPAAVGGSGVTLKRKKPEVPIDTGTEPKPGQTPVPPTPTSGTKSNTSKIVGGVAAAAALFAGVYFFGMKGDNKDVDDGGTPQTEQVAQVGETTLPETTSQTDVPEGGIAAEGESVNNDSEGAGTTNANETPATIGNENASVPTNSDIQPAQTKQRNSSTTKIPAASAPLGEDVVENAKRVIRGDFGVGRERKEKLGASYSEIQAKVNEIYRQKGLIP